MEEKKSMRTVLLTKNPYSVLSRAVGEKDKKTIDSIMGNLMCLVGLSSVFITILGMVFAKNLLKLSGATGILLDMSTLYLRIIFAGSLFVNFAQSSNMIMRGEGLLKNAMIIMGGGALLNIILDPIMIILMCKSGRGIEGAAYATLISQVIQAVAMLIYYLRYSKTVKIRGLKINKEVSVGVFKVGISAMLMQIMSLVQQTLLYNSAARYGGEESQILMAALLVLARQIVLFVPLVLIVPHLFNLGTHGVWLASAICDGIVVVLSVFMMKKQLNSLDNTSLVDLHSTCPAVDAG